MTTNGMWGETFRQCFINCTYSTQRYVCNYRWSNVIYPHFYTYFLYVRMSSRQGSFIRNPYTSSVEGKRNLNVTGSGDESLEYESGLPSEFWLSSSSDESSLLLELNNIVKLYCFYNSTKYLIK